MRDSRKPQPGSADTVVVLDFETTGLSPDQGERPIEIGAVLLEGARIVDRFQSLMNPGMRINSFIEGYTGISNAMVRKAPPCAEVMAGFATFIQGHNLVAHNASFDQKFLDAEFGRIRCDRQGDFACSMLVSRRIYPDAPNHKLGTLVAYKRLKSDGVFHRALADAEMAAHLWVALLGDIQHRYQISDIPFPVMRKLARTPKASVDQLLWQHSRSNKV
jgi:DNA polymerase-3 subunit epsilon